MNRREAAIALVALGTVPLPVTAQQGARVARIGYLASGSGDNKYTEEAFRQGLRDLGYVEGRNAVIEFRDVGGSLEQLPAIAAELVALKVDVIVASGTPAALAAKQATRVIPIVFPAAGDPVASGLVASLARPGGNVTGLSILNPGLIGKRLEQLKQVIPGADRIALLWNPGAYGERTDKSMLDGGEAAARTLGVRLQLVDVRGPADFDRAFSDMTRERASALIVAGGGLLNSHRSRLVELAAKARLPAAYPFRAYVEAGGLMSYGLDLADSYRRAAAYVNRILKGAKPGELPVEQPTKLELVINLQTAKSLGLAIPPSVLLRADSVIE